MAAPVRLLRAWPCSVHLAPTRSRRAVVTPFRTASSSSRPPRGDAANKGSIGASSAASNSGGFSDSSGRPSRRIPPPKASGSISEKSGAADKEQVTRATAAVAAKGSEIRGTGSRDKGKGKEKEAVKEEEIQPITASSSLDNGPLASTSASSTSTSSTEPKTEAEQKTVTTSDLSGPLDIASIPSLRSSFEDPLVGLSPSLGGSSENSEGTTTAAEFLAQSPSTSGDKNARPRTKASDAAESAQEAAALSLIPRHSFNTNKFVTSLTEASFPRPLATSLLQSTSSILSSAHKRVLVGTHGAVSKAHAEGQAYLYSAALSELRTEVQVKARNDGIALRSVVNGLQREVEALRQRLGEDVGTLRGEIQIDMNLRKEEGSTEMKGLEMSILELNSKFTILVGDVRTEIEARKWITTRRCIVAIAGLALAVILYTASFEEAVPSSRPSSAPPSADASNAGSGDRNKPFGLRTAEELGIRATEGDSTSWGLGGLGFKRVGEEDEQQK